MILDRSFQFDYNDSMARTKAFDEIDALNEAMGLFWMQGYEATSVRDLTGRLGISSSSLYATFGDKHEMFLAALKRYRALELEQVAGTLAAAGTAQTALEQMFGDLIDNLTADEPLQGSFTLNAAVELGGRDSKVAGQLREHFDDITDLLAGFLAERQAIGEVTHRFTAPQLARFILNALYSLAIAAKVYPDRSYLETIAAISLSIFFYRRSHNNECDNR